MHGRPRVQGRDGRAGDHGTPAKAPVAVRGRVGGVSYDEVGKVVPRVKPVRIGLETAWHIAAELPRHGPDRDTAPAVERDEIRLDVSTEPGGEVVRLQPANDRLLAVRHRGLGR